MTNDEIRAALLRCLSRVAPEIAGASIDPAADLREQADLDSVDFLNFLVELHRELGVEVPETEYREFSTVDSAVGWLSRRIAASAQP